MVQANLVDGLKAARRKHSLKRKKPSHNQKPKWRLARPRYHMSKQKQCDNISAGIYTYTKYKVSRRIYTLNQFNLH